VTKRAGGSIATTRNSENRKRLYRKTDAKIVSRIARTVAADHAEHADLLVRNRG
jgi:hypothetical protein